MKDKSDFVLIGLLRRAHGIKGEVSVEPVSDRAGRFEVLEYVLLRRGTETRRLEVESVRWKGRSVLLKFRGVDDRTSADNLSGSEIGIRREEVYPNPTATKARTGHKDISP